MLATYMGVSNIVLPHRAPSIFQLKIKVFEGDMERRVEWPINVSSYERMRHFGLRIAVIRTSSMNERKRRQAHEASLIVTKACAEEYAARLPRT